MLAGSLLPVLAWGGLAALLYGASLLSWYINNESRSRWQLVLLVIAWLLAFAAVPILIMLATKLKR